jgi:hypothetical protein
MHHFEVYVFNECSHADSCVINKYVDASEYFDGGFDESFAVLFLAYIAGNGMQKGACIAHLEIVYFIVVTRAGGNFGAKGNEHIYQRLSNTSAATGNDYYLIFKK